MSSPSPYTYSWMKSIYGQVQIECLIFCIKWIWDIQILPNVREKSSSLKLVELLSSVRSFLVNVNENFFSSLSLALKLVRLLSLVLCVCVSWVSIVFMRMWLRIHVAILFTISFICFDQDWEKFFLKAKITRPLNL